MFNESDTKKNGEEKLFDFLKNKIEIIFDVGCRSDSIFTSFDGEVHFFDPLKEELLKLKNLNKNLKHYFNSFGLSDEDKKVLFYKKYQSIFNRKDSCPYDDIANKFFYFKKSKNYLIEKNIKKINFLKIDVEGSELDVLKGFEDMIQIIDVIQFEYGGTYKDANIKLIDVINYLNKNFVNFAYLSNEKYDIIKNYEDHYKLCNIVCFNKNTKIDYKNLYNEI